MTDRETILFTICMALRKVPAATWRDMGKRRLPGDDLAEQAAAERILAHLELANVKVELRTKMSGPTEQMATYTPAR